MPSPKVPGWTAIANTQGAFGLAVQAPPTIDEATLAFVTADGATHLVFDQIDGNGTQQLRMAQAAVGSSYSSFLTSDVAFHSWRPKFSPSGHAILFNRNPSSDANYSSTFNHSSVWVCNSDGSNLTQLVASGALGTILTTPNWLPDGSKIIVEVDGNIYAVDPSTGAATLFTTGRTDWSDVCSSPDGLTWIGQANNHNLYKIDVPTATLTQLTFDGTPTAPAHFDPQFTPDGQWILFETRNSTSGNLGLGQWQIEKIRPDGSERTIISSTTGVVSNPQADRDGWVYMQLWSLAGGGFQVARIRQDGSTSTPIALSPQSTRAGNPDVVVLRIPAPPQIKPPATAPIAVTVGNSTTETVVLNRSIPANSLHAGSYYRIRAMGLASSLSASPGTLTFRIRFGTPSGSGTVLCSSAPTPVANLTNVGFSLEGIFCCHVVGPSGTAVVGAQLELRASTYLSPVVINTAQGAITSGPDTTVGNLLELSVQWQTANASNTISFTHITIEAV